jgi:hypothetical protein
MLATTLIYLSGLALCMAAGVAMIALATPGARWLTPATPAAGAALIIVLAYLFGFLLPGKTASVLVLVALAVLLVLALWPRRAALEQLLPTVGEWLVFVLGGGAGLLILAPVLSIGFPTTIASGIADGWSRSVLSEWLLDHALIHSSHPPGVARPIGSYSALPHELGAGYEYMVGLVSTVTGRPAYQVVLPVAALAAPIFVSGLAGLQALITARRTAAWQAIVLAGATLSPVFLLPFVDNYLTQFTSVSLWPFAMAGTAAFVASPTLRTAVIGATGLGALAGVYPPLAPWFGPAAVVLLVVGARHTPAALARRVPRRLRALAPIVAAVLGLGAALVVIAPVEVVRAYESVAVFTAGVHTNLAFPRFEVEQDLALVLGGTSQFTLARGQATAEVLAVLVPLLAVAAVGVLATFTMARGERRPMLALGGTVSAITLILYTKYKHGDDYGYGAYKALLSGGAVLAGLLMVVLASPSARWLPLRLAAAGACLAIWIPVATNALEHQRYGRQGFREPDNALIAEMQRLPRRDVLLVEGAADSASSFQLRMTTSYATEAFDRRVDGLGSTFTYLSRGGDAGWRPSRPWDWVVSSTQPSAFAAHRRTVWEEPPYRMQAAPDVDLTPYALSPPPSLHTTPRSTFWMTPSPGIDADYIAGPVELIVGNRHAAPVMATLNLSLASVSPYGTVVLGGDGAPRRVRLKRAPTTVRYRLPVPARGTARVTLDAGTPVVRDDGTLTPLLVLTQVGIS